MLAADLKRDFWFRCLIKIHLPAKTVYVECETEQPNDVKGS